MTERALLTVAFSTLLERAPGISAEGIGPETEVLVCVQGGQLGQLPRLPQARVVPVPGRGVAKSRNAAIAHATGRYLLFCDDDVVIDPEGIAAGIRHLQQTGHALALGRAVDPSGVMRKKYPRSVTRLTLYNSAKAATYEMLVDLDQIRAKDLWFDERFGAGAPLHLGDEYIFISDLLRAGLSGDAVPEIFGRHPVVSSGSRWGTPEDSHARAVAINRVFGDRALWARVAFGLKNRDSLGHWRLLMSFIGNRTRPPRGV
ncbi:glycosyltransferase family 2 protein [Streptomyces aidingensis]|uniref:Glycosyl transferase family 2 n=1 Tax=Streptomyces aidingensis TaxID=910347 RepID=A0A1I1S0Z8_9ACTN|nr:glycosyltransferase [Streptomyces aidingensis]SFD40264.1 Glycosyl transferase family 2 [Streptomyces aidingensis]